MSARAQAALRELYPHPATGRDQARALDLGLRRGLTVVSGGPGTGKTRTAAWLLALRLSQQPKLRCALAAPTGKAARRLGRSLAAAAGGLPPSLAPLKGALESVAAGACTLHHLLGWLPREDRCLRDAARPLEADLCVVDEASMMDVLQWKALLEALPKGASLVVLGDPRQLQSVEAGRVLGVMAQAAGPGAALAGCHAVLTENFRYADSPGIAALAEAVRALDPQGLLKASPPPGADAGGVEGLRPVRVDAALDRIWPEILDLAWAADPAAALKALDRQRILCAVNEGPWGVSGLRRRVEARLAREAAALGRKDWIRPLLILARDPEGGLSNGDVGVLMPDGRAWFDLGDGPKSFSPSRLPAHETAWAMSVHRSQGSEYATVLVLLPPGSDLSDGVRALLTPELLYTAVTRASQRVVLCADEAALRAVCAPREPRVTGLGRWLEKGE